MSTKKHAVAGGLGSVVGGALLFVLQNGGLVLGTLTVFQERLVPHIEGLQQNDLQMLVVGFAVLWVAYGVYRLLKKGAERFT